ncbi:MAG: hypothetical protein ACRDF4_07055, partial [Rhabdochlamydiaceae bacterium]
IMVGGSFGGIKSELAKRDSSDYKLENIALLIGRHAVSRLEVQGYLPITNRVDVTRKCSLDCNLVSHSRKVPPLRLR